jgi:hypothetical protein
LEDQQSLYWCFQDNQFGHHQWCVGHIKVVVSQVNQHKQFAHMLPNIPWALGWDE